MASLLGDGTSFPYREGDLYLLLVYAPLVLEALKQSCSSNEGNVFELCVPFGSNMCRIQNDSICIPFLSEEI